MSLRGAGEQRLKIGHPAVALPITIACGLGPRGAADLLGEGRLGGPGRRLRVGFRVGFLRRIGHGGTLAAQARCGKPDRLKNPAAATIFSAETTLRERWVTRARLCFWRL